MNDMEIAKEMLVNSMKVRDAMFELIKELWSDNIRLMAEIKALKRGE